MRATTARLPDSYFKALEEIEQRDPSQTVSESIHRAVGAYIKEHDRYVTAQEVQKMIDESMEKARYRAFKIKRTSPDFFLVQGTDPEEPSGELEILQVSEVKAAREGVLIEPVIEKDCSIIFS